MLEIIKAGVQSTVQDGGRHGLRHLGIAQSGALDLPAMQRANLLLGNDLNAAVIEIVAGPVEIRFGRDGHLALSGADFSATLDGEPLWSGWRYPCRRGQRLRLTGARHGMRAYLAVDGGIAVEAVLGARATDLKAGFGGHQGRALLAGDILPQGEAQKVGRKLGVSQPDWHGLIRALPGPEYSEFSAEARAAFWHTPWTVSSQSNRIGYRLQGQPLLREHGSDLLSHAVQPGIVQVPPGGQPIVLLADAQTTGGYPRIASVIAADLWLLAQARPGSALRFVECDHASARLALQQQARELQQLQWTLAHDD